MGSVRALCVCELFKFLVYKHPLLGLVCIHIQSSVVVVEVLPGCFKQQCGYGSSEVGSDCAHNVLHALMRLCCGCLCTHHAFLRCAAHAHTCRFTQPVQTEGLNTSLGYNNCKLGQMIQPPADRQRQQTKKLVVGTAHTLKRRTPHVYLTTYRSLFVHPAD